jgi:large subunit ribosomal protein L32e
MIKKIVALRNALKKRKPGFRNQCSHKIKGITTHYRKPRGLQSKMRLNKRGNMRKISIGYRSPREAYGLSREGLHPVIVHNTQQLSGLSAEKDGVIIAHGVGMRKFTAITQAAHKAKLSILNCKDPVAYEKQVNTILSVRKERRAQLLKSKAVAEKKTEKKVEKKEETKPTEGAKEQAKKELDKVLTQQQ